MKCKICGVRLSSSASAYKHFWHSHHNIVLDFIFKNTELEGFEGQIHFVRSAAKHELNRITGELKETGQESFHRRRIPTVTDEQK